MYAASLRRLRRYSRNWSVTALANSAADGAVAFMLTGRPFRKSAVPLVYSPPSALSVECASVSGRARRAVPVRVRQPADDRGDKKRRHAEPDRGAGERAGTGVGVAGLGAHRADHAGPQLPFDDFG